MTAMRSLVGEADPLVADLRVRLDDFYATTTSYEAFQGVCDHSDCWAHVRTAIESVIEKRGSCRVLEIGAGRTGFAGFLAELRCRVHFIAQDVTAQNAEFLKSQADTLHLGDISELEAEVDVIFSTYVLEHVTNPRAHLEASFAKLRPGGMLFIFSPRYDAPFYLCHSADHLGIFQRMRLGAKLVLRRIWTLLSSGPAFLVHLDPSVFHMPWAIDRDAVHWVSLFDLRAFFSGRGQMQSLRLPAKPGKDWIVKRCLTVAVMITKTA